MHKLMKIANLSFESEANYFQSVINGVCQTHTHTQTYLQPQGKLFLIVLGEETEIILQIKHYQRTSTLVLQPKSQLYFQY